MEDITVPDWILLTEESNDRHSQKTRVPDEKGRRER